jgi:hypothetical protein
MSSNAGNNRTNSKVQVKDIAGVRKPTKSPQENEYTLSEQDEPTVDKYLLQQEIQKLNQ